LREKGIRISLIMKLRILAPVPDGCAVIASVENITAGMWPAVLGHAWATLHSHLTTAYRTLDGMTFVLDANPIGHERAKQLSAQLCGEGDAA